MTAHRLGRHNPFADDLPQPIDGDSAVTLESTEVDANPYASPPSLEGYERHDQRPFGGLWRQGNLLVMHRSAQFPPLCVATNVPTTRKVKQILTTNDAWNLVSTNKAVHVGLSEPRWRHRRWVHKMSIGLGIIAGALILLACVLMPSEMHRGFLLVLAVAGVVTAISAGVWDDLYVKVVSVSRIRKEFFWLNGVHPDFLKRLPEWPYG